MALLYFGPFQENISSKRCLHFFITKDPPVVIKNELSRLAQRKKNAAKENSVRQSDPQRGPTTAVLLEQKKLSLKEATIELQARLFEEKLKEQRHQRLSDEVREREKGLRDDFQLIDKTYQQWAAIWERNPNNDFAMEQLKNLTEERRKAKAALEQHLSDHPTIGKCKRTENDDGHGPITG